MKKLYTLVFAICACISLQAQTITSSVAPVPGDVNHYLSDTLFHPAGIAGAGQNWDFSSLSFPPAISNENYISPSAAYNGSAFPAATVATGSAIDTSYSFFQVNQSTYTLLGSVQGANVINFSNPATYMTFPLSLNGTFTDTYSGGFSVNSGPIPIPVTIAGNINGTGDATGNMQLPGGVSYQGLLRIHTRVTQNVSASILGTPTNISATITHSWNWFNPGSKFPVFQLSIDSVQNFAVPITGQPASNSVGYSTSMRVNSTPTALACNEKNFAPFVYPNPGRGNTTVNFLSEPGETALIRVTDMTGAEVFSSSETGSGGLQNITLYTDSWASGIYLLQVNTGRGTHTAKLAIK